MHLSDNIEIMINDKTDEVIEELYESLLSRYHGGFGKLMRVGNFILDCISYCKCHEAKFKLVDQIQILLIG